MDIKNTDYIRLSNGKEYYATLKRIFGNYTEEATVIKYRLCVYDFADYEPAAVVIDDFCMERCVIKAIDEMEQYLIRTKECLR